MRENIIKVTGKAIYVCYFGLREPLVQTQVLPYIRQVCKSGVRFSLLTFEVNPGENWTNSEIESEKQKLADEGIDWNFLTYHKRPSVPATLFDILNGSFFLWKYIRREKPDILHTRIHVPALMGAIANKLTGRKSKLLFDIRGFFPEEYTDAGRWKKDGWLYHSVKKIEKWLFKQSDGFVILTERAREILFPESKDTGFDKFGRPVEVIPCCVDLDGFQNTNGFVREQIRTELKTNDRFVIIYVGSLGGWYMTDQMYDFFETVHRNDPKAFALILTPREKEKVFEQLKKRGFSDDDFFVSSVSPKEIPKYLSGADVALSFIEACYSKQASSPTKIAEYLAGGLPVIINPGVGDLDALVEGERVGVVINDFDDENYLNAIRQIKELKEERELSEICKMCASDHFDVEDVAGLRYRRLYRNLLNNTN